MAGTNTYMVGGTLAGAAVDILILAIARFKAKQVFISNDHGTNSYVVLAQGFSANLLPGETIRLVGSLSTITLNGTGAYRVWASDSSENVLDLAKPAGIPAGSISFAELQDSAAGFSVIGKPDTGAGDFSEITFAAQQYMVRGAANLVAQTVGSGEFCGRPVGGNLGVMTGVQAEAAMEGAGRGVFAAAYASAGTTPGLIAFVSRTLAVDNPGDTTIVLVLPAASTWEIVDAWLEQPTTGNALDTWQVCKAAGGGTPVGATVAFSATDGAVTRLGAIPNANKANNSFTNGDVINWRSVDGSGGAGDVRGKYCAMLRRLT